MFWISSKTMQGRCICFLAQVVLKGTPLTNVCLTKLLEGTTRTLWQKAAWCRPAQGNTFLKLLFVSCSTDSQGAVKKTACSHSLKNSCISWILAWSYSWINSSGDTNSLQAYLEQTAGLVSAKVSRTVCWYSPRLWGLHYVLFHLKIKSQYLLLRNTSENTLIKGFLIFSMIKHEALAHTIITTTERLL